MAFASFFLFGLLVGSFLNVCILRIPEGESIVRPGSHCPKCQKPIRPYDNIPVLSWLLLRGKCRFCRARISPMYPTIELLTGLLFVACYAVFGITIPTFKWILFSCLVLVLTVTDYRTRLLPDAVTWPGFGMGLVFSAVAPPHDGASQRVVAHFWQRPPEAALGVLEALLGAAFGSMLLWSAGALYKIVRGREGMGLGDVKMMAMVGAFVGLQDTFLTILLGTLFGSVLGLSIDTALFLSGWKREVAARASRRGLGPLTRLRIVLASRYQLPLGTYLGVAALLIVFLLRPPILYRLMALR